MLDRIRKLATISILTTMWIPMSIGLSPILSARSQQVKPDFFMRLPAPEHINVGVHSGRKSQKIPFKIKFKLPPFATFYQIIPTKINVAGAVSVQDVPFKLETLSASFTPVSTVRNISVNGSFDPSVAQIGAFTQELKIRVKNQSGDKRDGDILLMGTIVP
ncbi:hypothetical protein [Chamaesiphon polymorphus]|uniref:Uncharacterized protein n=1 Tax=Chamaesiphon polymorphus CCALA 037 TaxID=2107692 RepID=A0A2T1GC27_9CYAN|nr:hypothetical protein [Chamaesiphon polymorphus]PSB54922.1 hypothetical protein C7B77_16660 [Chamaesiphon polymorphus CCALA 037]